MIDDQAFLAGIGHILAEIEAGHCTPSGMRGSSNHHQSAVGYCWIQDGPQLLIVWSAGNIQARDRRRSPDARPVPLGPSAQQEGAGRLRRAVHLGDLGRPSEPDGKARPQARPETRGEPPDSAATAAEPALQILEGNAVLHGPCFKMRDINRIG
jgi:hypothetical protein